MMIKAVVACLLVWGIKCVHSAPCTKDPVEEGSTVVITQTVPKTSVTNGHIKWRLTSLFGSDVTLTECNINNNPPCTSPLLGEDIYSSTLVSLDRYYLVTLIIHNVNRLRDQTTLKWTSGFGSDNVIGQCDLDVYSSQSSPVCQALGTSPNGNTVSWRCTVSNVYPEMECRFEKRKESGSYQWITQNVGTQKITTDGKYPPRTVYHDYTCTMNLPVSQLGGEGTYQFRFIAAVVKGSSTLKTSSPIVKDLKLAYPQVELLGCPNADDSTQGYISEKDNTKTCQCRLKELGNPLGVAQWRNAQGRLVGQNGILSLVYNPDDQHPPFTCRGHSGLGSGPAITYKPKFAYGPSAITLAFQSDTMNKCGPDASFTTYCDIAMANVDPEPTTLVTTSDGSTVTELPRIKTAGYFRHKFRVTPKKAGNLTVTCSSFNPVFPDLRTGKSKTIEVQGPPQSSPVMTIEVGQQPAVAISDVVSVTNGDVVKVTCRVDGGYPLVNEVTTICAGVKNVNGGTQATQTMYVKIEDNNKKCVCEAKHITGCYDKTSEFTLNVRYRGLHAKVTPEPHYDGMRQDELNITCSFDGPPYWAKKVATLEVTKNGGKPIAVLSNQNLTLGSNVDATMQAEGHIEDDVSSSFLKLIIKGAKVKDVGLYTCMLFYTDLEDQLIEQQAFVNVTIDSLDMTAMVKYLVGKMSKLEDIVREQDITIMKKDNELISHLEMVKSEEKVMKERDHRTNEAIGRLEAKVRNLNKILGHENYMFDCMAKLEEQEKRIIQQEITIANYGRAIGDQGKQLKDQVEIGNFSSAFSVRYNNIGVILNTRNMMPSFPMTNVGGNYNTSSGVFTAPRKGLYVFHLAVTTNYRCSVTYVDLVANDRTVDRLNVKDKGNKDQSSISTVISLDAGDEVKPVVSGRDERWPMLSVAYIRFTGYLLKLL